MDRLTKDRRRALRQPHDSVLEIIDDIGSVPGRALRLVDASSLGVSFVSLRVFAKGAPIHARLRLLSGVLEVWGKVVRIKKRTNSTLYGVKFDSVWGACP